MKKTILIIVLATLCLNFGVKAQDQPNIIALKIGDQLPNITINNIINYQSKTLKLFDFKDKLLILDFWATWCSSCINRFSDDYRLQRKYNSSIQFLFINSKGSRDDLPKIKHFNEQHAKEYSLPIVYNDSILTEMFPHKEIPHCVWIKNNEVIAITNAQDITEAKIDSVLAQRQVHFDLKRDLSYNPKKPLFIDGNGGAPQFFYRSILTKYVDGLKSTYGVNYEKNRLVTRIYSVNGSILRLFLQAYPEYSNFSINRIIFNVENSAEIFSDSSSTKWDKKNLYTYEFDFPPTDMKEALKMMKIDLNRYFKIHLNTEDRMATCLVIRRSSEKINSVFSTEEGSSNIYERNSKPKFIRNFPLQILVDYLNSSLKVPVIDATGYTDNLSLDLPSNLKDLPALKQSLESQGFVVNEENRRISYLIFNAD